MDEQTYRHRISALSAAKRTGVGTLTVVLSMQVTWTISLVIALLYSLCIHTIQLNISTSGLCDCFCFSVFITDYRLQQWWAWAWIGLSSNYLLGRWSFFYILQGFDDVTVRVWVIQGNTHQQEPAVGRRWLPCSDRVTGRSRSPDSERHMAATLGKQSLHLAMVEYLLS